VRDRAAKRTFFSGAIDIDVNPLPVAGTFGELVDSGLIDIDPVRCAEALANEVFHVGQRDFRHNSYLVIEFVKAAILMASWITAMADMLRPPPRLNNERRTPQSHSSFVTE
jgi:hypothetical protein